MNRGLSLSTPLFRKYIIQPSLVFSFVFSSLWGRSWDTGPPWALFSDLESHPPMKIHHCFSELPSALLFLGTLSREWEGPWCHLETAAGGRVCSLGGLGVSNSAFQRDLVHGSEPRSNSTSGPALQGRARPALPPLCWAPGGCTLPPLPRWTSPANCPSSGHMVRLSGGLR